jgi:dephospho-CoA kinase
LLVECNEQNQIDRVMQRNGHSKPEIRAMISLQRPQPERIKQADDVIQNDGTRDNLKKQVTALHFRYLNFINNHLTAK